MIKTTVAVELEQDVAASLDAVAESLGGDRSAAVRAALLSLDAERRIVEGLRQAERGEFATDSEVARAFRRVLP
jgi:predicted transcriptional regulator